MDSRLRWWVFFVFFATVADVQMAARRNAKPSKQVSFLDAANAFTPRGVEDFNLPNEFKALPKYKHMCSECPYGTNKLCDIKKHNLIHTNQWPFECKGCAYKTRTSSHILVHERKYGHEWQKVQVLAAAAEAPAAPAPTPSAAPAVPAAPIVAAPTVLVEPAIGAVRCCPGGWEICIARAKWVFCAEDAAFDPTLFDHGY